jgi:hypothetical protein
MAIKISPSAAKWIAAQKQARLNLGSEGASEPDQATPSNKPKTPAIQGSPGREKGTPSAEPAPISPAPILLVPIIDKLSITLTIPPGDLEDIHKAVYTAYNDTAVFQSVTKLKGFKSARMIAIRGSAERVHFCFGSKTGEPPHARLEFNPGKLGKDGLEWLHATLMTMMDGGWEYVLNHGRITRVDVAVDIPKSRMHQFLLMPAQGLATTCIYNGNGKLKTVYVGKKDGNQTVLYSKSAEQAVKEIYLPVPTVRLERKLRNPQMALKELLSLKNPFAALKLISTMPPAPETPAHWSWPLFLDAVAQRGLVAALLLLPEKRRTIYRKHLEQHQVDWWDSAAAWEHWPKTVSNLLIPF